MNSIWNTNPLWLAGFASSAAQFAADFNQTYCVSHQEDDGLVTIGSREWKDYKVESIVYFSLHKSGGLVVRSTGINDIMELFLRIIIRHRYLCRKMETEKFLQRQSLYM